MSSYKVYHSSPISIEDYYLDLKALDSLDNRNKEFIHSYYKDMVCYFSENRIVGISFFNTLLKGGYLKNMKVEERDEKLNILL